MTYHSAGKKPTSVIFTKQGNRKNCLNYRGISITKLDVKNLRGNTEMNDVEEQNGFEAYSS